MGMYSRETRRRWAFFVLSPALTRVHDEVLFVCIVPDTHGFMMCFLGASKRLLCCFMDITYSKGNLAAACVGVMQLFKHCDTCCALQLWLYVHTLSYADEDYGNNIHH